MRGEWEINYFGIHGFLIQEVLTDDIIKKCRIESSIFNDLYEKLIEKEENIWKRSL